MNQFFDRKSIKPSLCVLGAGPGDPELLTIKGFTALKSANVILYDNLANKELLNIATSCCDKVFVGKKPYSSTTTQEEINNLIIHYALTKGNVVRLKGGDPFIFGRGFEEIIFARQHGIKTSFIPGISSMQAIGLQDIPLTHRGLSESVWAITGTNKDGSLSSDLHLAVQSKGTVVIYMGMKRLLEIANVYTLAGKGSIPAAIIQNASLKQQQKVYCQVKDLHQTAITARLSNPSIIIIGNVVRAADAYTSKAPVITEAFDLGNY